MGSPTPDTKEAVRHWVGDLIFDTACYNLIRLGVRLCIAARQRAIMESKLIMPQLLVIASSGPENPTRATLPFHLAKAAKEGGKDVAIVLAADASPMANPTIRENVTGVGFPPFKEFYAFMQESGVPVYI